MNLKIQARRPKVHRSLTCIPDVSPVGCRIAAAYPQRTLTTNAVRAALFAKGLRGEYRASDSLWSSGPPPGAGAMAAACGTADVSHRTGHPAQGISSSPRRWDIGDHLGHAG